MEAAVATIESEEMDIGLSSPEFDYDYIDDEKLTDTFDNVELPEELVEPEGDLIVEGVIDELGTELLLDGKVFDTGSESLRIEIVDGILLAYDSDKIKVVAESEVVDTESGVTYKAVYYTDGKGGWSLRTSPIEEAVNLGSETAEEEITANTAPVIIEPHRDQYVMQDAEQDNIAKLEGERKSFQATESIGDDVADQEYFFENVFATTEIVDEPSPVEEEELAIAEYEYPLPELVAEAAEEVYVLSSAEAPIETLVEAPVEQSSEPTLDAYEPTVMKTLEAETGISISVANEAAEVVMTHEGVEETEEVEEPIAIPKIIKSINITGISISIKKEPTKKRQYNVVRPMPISLKKQPIAPDEPAPAQVETITIEAIVEATPTLPQVELSSDVVIADISKSAPEGLAVATPTAKIEPVVIKAAGSGISITVADPEAVAKAKVKTRQVVQTIRPVAHIKLVETDRQNIEPAPAQMTLDTTELKQAILERAPKVLASITPETTPNFFVDDYTEDNIGVEQLLDTPETIKEAITISFAQPTRSLPGLQQERRSPAQTRTPKVRSIKSRGRKRANIRAVSTPQPVTINFSPTLDYQTVATLAQAA